MLLLYCIIWEIELLETGKLFHEIISKLGFVLSSPEWIHFPFLPKMFCDIFVNIFTEILYLNHFQNHYRTFPFAWIHSFWVNQKCWWFWKWLGYKCDNISQKVSQKWNILVMLTNFCKKFSFLKCSQFSMKKLYILKVATTSQK